MGYGTSTLGAKLFMNRTCLSTFVHHTSHPRPLSQEGLEGFEGVQITDSATVFQVQFRLVLERSRFPRTELKALKCVRGQPLLDELRQCENPASDNTSQQEDCHLSLCTKGANIFASELLASQLR
jgi:hypothetical protein